MQLSHIPIFITLFLFISTRTSLILTPSSTYLVPLIHSGDDLFTCLSSSFTSQYSSKSACGTSIPIDQTSSLFPSACKLLQILSKLTLFLVKSGSYTTLSVDVEFSVLQTCSSVINCRIDLLSIT